MGIFGKGKKDKDKTESKTKSKSKKRVQDRFMVHALGAKFVNAKSSEILEYEFTQAFSEHNVKVTGARTDRLVLGRGKFDKPYQHTKEITRKYARYISGDDDPSDRVVAEMIVEFEKLETLANEWLQSDEAKWSNKDESKKDAVTQLKEIEARGMLEGARTALFQLRNRDRLEDDANLQLFAKLEAARDKLEDPGTATAKAREECRGLDAEVLSALCGSDQPPNGTSDVKLIKGPDGEVAYAFKSVAGESDMMGTPKGFATAREVMMSKLCATLREQYQIGLGWPQVSMSTVGNKPGALIDGVKGMRDLSGAFSRDDIPAEALQQILLGNLAGGQFDIKWEDVRFERQGDTLAPTCMDGGASMPDTITATTFLVAMSDGRPGATMLDNNGQDPENRTCAGAKERMSPALVKQFLAIDTAALKKELDTEAQRLETDHKLGVKALGLDSGVQTSITSIEGIQKILRDSGGDITLVDFMKLYHSQVIQKKFVEPNLQAWEQLQLDEFARVRRMYPGLFHTADKFGSVSDIYRDVLHPEMRQKLKALADVAKPQSIVELMRKFGRAVPVTTIMRDLNAVNIAIKTINDGLKGYDRLEKKYPGIIKPRTSFATPEEAYLEVLDEPQEKSLDRLNDICKALAKTEGQTVTMAQLLQRSGCPVPTSNFKKILETVRAAEAKRQQGQGQAQQDER